jgi:hypothetical protein
VTPHYPATAVPPSPACPHPASQWGIHAGRSWELIEGLDGGQTQVDQPADGTMAVWGHPLDVHYTCRGLSGWPKLHVQVWSQDVHGRNELSESHRAWLGGILQRAAGTSGLWPRPWRRRPRTLRACLAGICLTQMQQQAVLGHPAAHPRAGALVAPNHLPRKLPRLPTSPEGYGFCHIPTAPGMFELACPTWLPEVSAPANRPRQCFRGNSSLALNTRSQPASQANSNL